MGNSSARVEANRLNALRSTGPKTDEGKERSRANAFKHGLTGAGVVLEGDDASAVDRKRAAYLAELAPSTTVGADLAGRAALLSVRLDRARRHDEAATARRLLHAVDRFDDDCTVEVETLHALLMSLHDNWTAGVPVPPDSTPGLLVRQLARTRAGIDLLLLGWRKARAVAIAQQAREADGEGGGGRLNLSPHDRRQMILLAGLYWDRVALSPETAIADDILHNRADGDSVVAWIDARVARLETLRDAIDPLDHELDRRRSADLALFDTSREAERVRQYELKAERALLRTLSELRRVEAAPAESPADPDPKPAPAPVPAPKPAPRPADVDLDRLGGDPVSVVDLAASPSASASPSAGPIDPIDVDLDFDLDGELPPEVWLHADPVDDDSDLIADLEPPPPGMSEAFRRLV